MRLPWWAWLALGAGLTIAAVAVGAIVFGHIGGAGAGLVVAAVAQHLTRRRRAVDTHIREVRGRIEAQPELDAAEDAAVVEAGRRAVESRLTRRAPLAPPTSRHLE